MILLLWNFSFMLMFAVALNKNNEKTLTVPSQKRKGKASAEVVEQQEHSRQNTACITAFLQPYDAEKDYDEGIILRNEYLYDHFYKFFPTYTSSFLILSFIIFHDNVTLSHQKYIQERSSSLPLQFIDISKELQQEEQSYLRSTRQESFTEKGRRNIRNKIISFFWFSNFRYYVENYDFMIRIDHNFKLVSNNLNHIIRRILYPSYALSESLPTPVPVSTTSSRSVRFASIKWTQLTKEDRFSHLSNEGNHSLGSIRDFVQRFASKYHYSHFSDWHTPYPHFYYLDLVWMRNQRLIAQFMQLAIDWKGIVEHNWKEHELWGAITRLMEESRYLLNVQYMEGKNETILFSDVTGGVQLKSGQI